MSEDKELRKLKMLLNAMETLNNNEDEPDFFGELKMAAWNILHENPGLDCDEWQRLLIEQYPTEVVDAIGSHPAETYAALTDMWETEDFEDEDTEEFHTFAEWAEVFATDRSVQLYDSLAESKREIRRLKAQQGQ